MDLDRFKAVNDTYGHGVGDRVLARTGSICRATLRSDDLFGRLGGEEFTILLPATGADEARQVAERLRASFGEADWGAATGSAPVTASFGVAIVEPQAGTLAACPGEGGSRSLCGQGRGPQRRPLRLTVTPWRDRALTHPRRTAENATLSRTAFVPLGEKGGSQPPESSPERRGCPPSALTLQSRQLPERFERKFTARPSGVHRGKPWLALPSVRLRSTPSPEGLTRRALRPSARVRL